MPPPLVKILEDSRVTVPATAALPPEPLVLSALDAEWIALPLIQRLLIFVDDGESHRPIPPFASVVAALRASLAETAARFPVMAGRIVHVPATGDAAIDCADDGGVRFLVAEMGHVDARRLAEDEDHDADAFRRLVPVLDAGQLPAEAMAAQVTRLRGGVALGVAMHHAVVDGRSVWRFIQAWAAACRGEEGDAELAAHAPPPTFDRKAIRLPGGEELARSVLRKYTPNLPKYLILFFHLVLQIFKHPGIENILQQRSPFPHSRDPTRRVASLLHPASHPRDPIQCRHGSPHRLPNTAPRPVPRIPRRLLILAPRMEAARGDGAPDAMDESKDGGGSGSMEEGSGGGPDNRADSRRVDDSAATEEGSGSELGEWADSWRGVGLAAMEEASSDGRPGTKEEATSSGRPGTKEEATSGGAKEEQSSVADGESSSGKKRLECMWLPMCKSFSPH
ncbi:hypothetical protein PR202_ga30597 [Eleusine coracana subsp. coracana]|uniref:Uncharacterized protein n=1 Tax=Eleusine coracana subsp. coracana TaxID=191504 RepID=A0AAV5DMZ2_ELECO|nr:hypothetical protein PR202_ga30597 [Eleusine coracana subsp. coracana]